MSVSRRGDSFCFAETQQALATTPDLSPVEGLIVPRNPRHHTCYLSDTHTHDHQCCCGFEWPQEDS
jgi:hypothetical protein